MSFRKKTRISRRQFIGSAAGAAVVMGTSPVSYSSPAIQAAAQTPAAAITPDTTLALTNGRIHTMNAANAVVTSVTIRNGQFVTALYQLFKLFAQRQFFHFKTHTCKLANDVVKHVLYYY